MYKRKGGRGLFREASDSASGADEPNAEPSTEALAARDAQRRVQARELWFPVARKLFQTMVAATALDLLRRELLGIETEPRYFRERVRRR